MDQGIVSVAILDSSCAFAMFCEVRTFERRAFFFESADEIGGTATLSVIGVGGLEALDGTAFASLEAAGAGDVSEVPFATGGVFGCIGYDAVTELEPKLAGRGNFAKAHGSHALLKATQLIVFDRRTGLVHFIRTPVRAQVARAKARAALGELAPERLLAAMGRDSFFAGVDRLKSHIRAGDIFQAVLAERFECEVRASSLEIFAALRDVSPTPYSFFFSFGDRDFFGASPEALLRVESGRLRTHPIAGTRPRGVTEIEDLRMRRQLERSRKEAAEHLMLVDLARNDLGRVASAGSVQVNFFRSVQKFSNVMHLVSEVDARLSDNYSPAKALGACFPAGTLSGAPKFRAMQLLAEIETVPRGFYGGAVVAYDPAAKRLDSCIAIRSLEMRGSRAVLRAGAGIVADSKPQAEYDEIHHKLKPLRQAIQLAESK